MEALILLRSWQESQIEIWVPSRIPMYDVSNFGRIRSWRKKVANTGHGPEGIGFRSIRADRPTTLNPSRGSSGYPYLNATYIKQGCPKIHRLVAEAFIANPDGLPQINHRTGVKTDVRIGNLEWATALSNMQHANQYGLRDVDLKGELHPLHVLTEDDVREIRIRAAHGESRSSIALDFPIKKCTVDDVVGRRTWTHI